MKMLLCRYGRIGLAWLALGLSGIADTEPKTPHTEGHKTFVIPIQGMIERGLLYVVRRGFAEALAAESSTIIFEMNTPGGRLDAAEEIIRMLIDLPDRVHTCTYVKQDALSAGALIALATDEIYMSPGSRIGASALVTMTGDIPDGDMKNKVVSATLALVRSAAQRKGHRADLADAMINADFEYRLGDEIISKKGELLTLSEFDAARRIGEDGSPLLSAGTVDSLDDLLTTLGLRNGPIEFLQATSLEQIARWIEMFSILFLAGGLLGLYIEFKTPGFGLPGLLGILLLAIWFWGHRVAGLAGMGELALFLVGVALLGVEIFALPGFGFLGFAGIGCMVASVIMAMVQHHPGGSWMPPLSQVEGAIRVLGLSLIIVTGFAVLLARYLPSLPLLGRVVLAAAQSHDEGYSASPAGESLVGQLGVALTPLRPAGVGRFGDRRVDVVARGAFIEPGRSIIVAEQQGNHIVVDADVSRG